MMDTPLADHIASEIKNLLVERQSSLSSGPLDIGSLLAEAAQRVVAKSTLVIYTTLRQQMSDGSNSPLEVELLRSQLVVAEEKAALAEKGKHLRAVQMVVDLKDMHAKGVPITQIRNVLKKKYGIFLPQYCLLDIANL